VAARVVGRRNRLERVRQEIWRKPEAYVTDADLTARFGGP